MYVVEAYVCDIDVEAPASEGQTPDFWRVFQCAMRPEEKTVTQKDKATWLADCAPAEIAGKFVKALESQDDVSAGVASPSSNAS